MSDPNEDLWHRLGLPSVGAINLIFAGVLMLAVAGAVFAEQVSAMSVAVRGQEDGATPGIMRFLSIAMVVVCVLTLITYLRVYLRERLLPREVRGLAMVSLAANYTVAAVAAALLAFAVDDLTRYADGSETTIRWALFLYVICTGCNTVFEWRQLRPHTGRRNRR